MNISYSPTLVSCYSPSKTTSLQHGNLFQLKLTNNLLPMEPTISPSTVTDAEATRWITAFILYK